MTLVLLPTPATPEPSSIDTGTPGAPRPGLRLRLVGNIPAVAETIEGQLEVTYQYDPVDRMIRSRSPAVAAPRARDIAGNALGQTVATERFWGDRGHGAGRSELSSYDDLHWLNALVHRRHEDGRISRTVVRRPTSDKCCQCGGDDAVRVYSTGQLARHRARRGV